MHEPIGTAECTNCETSRTKHVTEAIMVCFIERLIKHLRRRARSCDATSTCTRVPQGVLECERLDVMCVCSVNIPHTSSTEHCMCILGHLDYARKSFLFKLEYLELIMFKILHQ